MQIIECEQGTPEWHQARLGIVTASKFKDVLSKGRGSVPSRTRRSYMIRLVAERLSGETQDSYTNAAMEWGTQTEPAARGYYGFVNNIEPQEVGFILMDENIGASPDGLIGEDGLIEIKCPNTMTQVETVLSGEAPSEHMAQIQGQLLVTEREWCDFVSYDPRITGGASYFCKRVYRDERYLVGLRQALSLFVEELLELTDQLSTLEAA